MPAFVFAILVLFGRLALADQAMVDYGTELCRVVAADQSLLDECGGFVGAHAEMANGFGLTVAICDSFNFVNGPPARTVACYLRATEMIPRRDVKTDSELCQTQHRNEYEKEPCLRSLFQRLNVEFSRRR